ncbi:uncharacterized protein KY384_000199 [Bacidia gigantensis]|uniref:uncharacterized protein n=1 Tax=Bacidia gigantensis TaxID=2732470 RepID=UPI001D05AF80|nr:uncharacterized protein KY384_000199 [Bacidia gigantensis]KAG8526206.1 hypothetical protein KY384_000199 [Bacidia gigantensis]
MAHLTLAKELGAPPPHGKPYSVIVPGSEKEGRSPIYRHHRFKDGPLKTLDPNVLTAHDMFENTGSVPTMTVENPC